MNIVIIDGNGGRMGKLIIEHLKRVVACRRANVIVGPNGIVIADALHGEITPEMAKAVGQSQAEKVLVPVNRCNHHIVGLGDISMSELVRQACDFICAMTEGKKP